MRPVVAAFLIFLAAAPGVFAGPSGNGPAPDYPQIGVPDQAKGRALLDQLRQSGFATGGYFLEFELREMPRHGDDEVFHGRLWGGRNEQGTVMRIALDDRSGREHRLLFQNGPAARVWTYGGGPVEIMPPASLLQPLVEGVELTAFDLQMPFLFWPDARLLSLNRIRGRPAYAFLFRAPAAFAAVHPELAAVRAYLDAEFDAPVQIELIGPDGGVRKTTSLLDLAKIDGQWVLKEFDVRTETTRDKTRFILTAAALGLDFDPAWFLPAHLAEAAVPPKADRIAHLAP